MSSLGRIRKLLGLSSSDKLLLVESMAMLSLIKVGLWLLPFRTLRRLLVKHEESSAVKAEDEQLIRNVTGSIKKIGLSLPLFKNCLNQALAAQVLLNRRGQRVKLCIGVARQDGEEFQAHAWLESHDRIVLGRLKKQRTFTPLPSFEGKGL
jgi:hypothetical protein